MGLAPEPGLATPGSAEQGRDGTGTGTEAGAGAGAAAPSPSFPPSAGGAVGGAQRR